jgi:hypothetical protein
VQFGTPWRVERLNTLDLVHLIKNATHAGSGRKSGQDCGPHNPVLTFFTPNHRAHQAHDLEQANKGQHLFQTSQTSHQQTRDDVTHEMKAQAELSRWIDAVPMNVGDESAACSRIVGEMHVAEPKLWPGVQSRRPDVLRSGESGQDARLIERR